jgi:hypothetical protein
VYQRIPSKKNINWKTFKVFPLFSFFPNATILMGLREIMNDFEILYLKYLSNLCVSPIIEVVLRMSNTTKLIIAWFTSTRDCFALRMSMFWTKYICIYVLNKGWFALLVVDGLLKILSTKNVVDLITKKWAVAKKEFRYMHYLI